MNKHIPFIIVFFITFATSYCMAAEYERLTVDLDGDNKPEVIVMSTLGTGDFQDFTVRIKDATYTDKFFAVDGNLPELDIITVDYKRPTRQLLIKTSEPAWCNFHLLSYSSHRLYSLLKFKSDGDCVSPQPHGNGTLSVSNWQGVGGRWKPINLIQQEQNWF
jgi:hypothetical protein